ncbi:MAG: aldehyde dehydrogenase family protein, partial [Taibaiella sp.]|nr:aldehyde dehydrogenase family protein [Taibaiella sp.]
EEVLEKIRELSKSQKIIIGDPDRFDVMGADKEKGAFLPRLYFITTSLLGNQDCHNIEAFGPVSTIMPYQDIEEAVALANLGKGSLVSSMVTYDDELARQYVLAAANMHGRILILNRDCAKESTGHGSPMPMLIHGGPGTCRRR